MKAPTFSPTEKRIAFPHPPGSGGPGSFQLRFESYLRDNQWQISYAGEIQQPDVVFVVGGTRRIGWLRKMKRKGIPIVYRLDGINWLHKKTRTGIKKFILAESRNLLNKLIHAWLADYIIYQSSFVRDWWARSSWRSTDRYSIIYNGVSLDVFQPNNTGLKLRLICVEGTLDYSPYAVQLMNSLRTLLPDEIPMHLYGRFEKQKSYEQLHTAIDFKGKVPREKIQDVFQNAIYLSLDIHPACPNTVIEALASGAPVVAFDSGSLKELVPPEAGIVVPYGSDPWQLAYPDDEALSKAILEVYDSWDEYSKGARRTAMENYGMEEVFSSYLNVIGKLCP